jgi:hypothetical protein
MKNGEEEMKNFSPGFAGISGIYNLNTSTQRYPVSDSRSFQCKEL